jgi:SpoVK/Ycf46/Vps4 family AAA+-type ATPase
MNTILETNTTPAIWITNTVSGVDPAYLRRFDMVVNVSKPVARAKRRMASRAFKDLPLSKSTVDRIIQHQAITGAHMQKVSKICERIGVETAGEAQNVVRHVINGELRAVKERPLVTRSSRRKGGQVKLPYRPSLVNCDTDIVDLAEKLRPGASVRICSFGPPGTGKTAWAKSLADKLQRPLLVKQAADILAKYVGETEENIVEIFKEAEATRSVLVLDEIDSFLPDRTNLDKHWEVTQANQFLTAMEEYQGILVCTTNLKESLDPATMRRFDFKITFDYLKPEQASEVAFDLMDMLDLKLSKESRAQLRFGLEGLQLTHGDFAALLRRYLAIKGKPDWKQLVADLKWETSFRQKAESTSIGFLANV